MRREAEIKRVTTETRIDLKLSLDGTGKAAIETGVPFLDHMLCAFARHGRFDLSVAACGDLQVDAHHLLEDVGLVLGEAIRQALADKARMVRYGWALIPMDEALVRVALDLSGRPYLGYRVQPEETEVGGVGVRLFREFFQGLVNTGGMSLHIDLLTGSDAHHAIEAVFKAFGRALDQAVREDSRTAGIPSTKGVLA